MSYSNYEKATNMAYQILLHYGLFDLPIDVYGLIRNLPKNIHVRSYTELMRQSGTAYGELLSVMPSEKGFFAYRPSNNQYLIYYNDFMNDKSIRFTIAHELGHYFLGHIVESDWADREANCFARNFLSPYPVITSAHLTTPESISASCAISDFAAQVRLERRSSDQYWTSANLFQALVSSFDCEWIYMLYA